MQGAVRRRPLDPTPSSRTPTPPAARTSGRPEGCSGLSPPRCAVRRSPGLGLPREESRGALEDVALLLQAPDALAQLPELLALGAGQRVMALTAVGLLLLAPVAQRLLRDPQRLSDVRDQAPRPQQPDRLAPELLRIRRSRLRHASPSYQRRLRRKCSGLRKNGGIPLRVPRRASSWCSFRLDRRFRTTRGGWGLVRARSRQPPWRR